MSKFSRTSKSAFIFLGILGVLIISTLVVISSYFLRPAMEFDLRGRLVAGFSKEGLADSIIDIAGQDITLRGSVLSKDEAMKAEVIAKRTWGVRQVENNLLVIGE